MEFVFAYRFVPRSFLTSFLPYAPITLFTPLAEVEQRRREFIIEQNSTRLRRRVLRRDGYRCRGCDQDGLDVTLAVHGIHPDATEEDETLALCRQCFDVVRGEKIVGSHIPEFLQRLWTKIHSASST